jgi:hypothetical protein
MESFQQGWLSDSNAHRAKAVGELSDGNPRLLAGPGGIKAVLFFLFLAISPLFASPAQAQGTFGCSPAMANDVVCENTKTGTPPASGTSAPKMRAIPVSKALPPISALLRAERSPSK